MTVLALVALVMSLVALSRTGARGEMGRRIARLEEEIRALRRALGVPGEPREATAARGDERSVLPVGAEPSPPPSSRPWSVAPEPAESREPPPPRAEMPSTAEAAERAETGAPSGATPSGAAPPPPPESAAPPARPAPPSSPVDWERWLGVRGAAVLGGAVLALAGLFFFRYSIEHGLIPPWLRVIVGTAAGVAAIGGAEWALRTRYAGTANALAGGGLVILYAAFWAAGVLYDLVPPSALFLLLVVVTAAGCALSFRHDSMVIAVIGLVGGFLTPLFAAGDSDRPIGLFAYILVLDASLLLIARRKRWPILALLSLAGTVAYQLLWIGGEMGASRTLLGLGILALFALVFVAAAPREASSRSASWRWSQIGAVLLPFAFAIYFAASARLDVGIVPLGGLLVVLGLAAGWLAQRHGEGALALGAAAATLAVLFAWTVGHPRLDETPWRAALVLVLVAASHQAAVELARRAGGRGSEPAAGAASAAGAARDPVANAAALVGVGLLALTGAVGAFDRVSLWPLLGAWLGVAAVLVRQGTLPGRGATQIAAALGVGAGLAGHRLAHLGGALPDAPGDALLLPVALAVAALGQVVALAQAGRGSHRAAEHAAATLATVLLLGSIPDAPESAPVALGTSFAFGFLVLLAATRLGGGPWTLVAVGATALAHFAWTMDLHPRASLAGLALATAAAAVFTAWPRLVAERLREDRWPWRAAALAGPAWLPTVLVLFENRFGDAAIGLVPLLLGAITIAAAAGARDLWPEEDERRTSALAWLCGAALGLVTIAIPLQLDREWITIGWALEGAALALLWTRLDHPGLKLTALALLATVTVRLVANDAVLAYHPRPEWRIVNWIAYTYLVPAAALAWTAKLLQPLEVARLRDWERPLYFRLAPLGAAAAGFAALAVVFVWINLAIADWFSTGTRVDLFLDRTPAQKLATSIAWAAYAIALLGLGIRLASGALRWASLGLLVVTIGKIFLYDVGQLRDLYRVGALLGLALSLIAVSLVYQRFVFRRPDAAEGRP